MLVAEHWQGMHSSRRATPMLLAAACLSLAAAATADATTGSAALKQYLPRSGELPGFSAAGPVHSVATVGAGIANDPPAVRSSDRTQLRKDGFSVEVEQLYDYRPGGSVNTSQGLASVTAFRTPAGAHAYQDFTFALESKPSAASGTAQQTRFVQLSVPGVPGAKGAAGIGRSTDRSAVNVEWVEGTCLIQLGDSVPGRATVKAPLISAAQAIARRTQDACTA